nr:PREDICTED: uncharacterized protein LOC109041659 [Bemisia tabaci]
MATFCVVIFPCDNTVDIVRESWLCGLNDDFEELCKFPPVKGDRKKLQNLLLQQEEPHPSWQEYVIVAKRTGIESYSEAVRLLKIIQEDEDGVTTDPEQLGRGWRSPKRKRIISSSEEDNPQVKKAKLKIGGGRKKSREVRSNAQNLCTSSLQDFKIPHCKSFRIPSPTLSSSIKQSNSKAGNPTYATSTQKPFLSPLMDISNIYPTLNLTDQAEKNKETGPLKNSVPQNRLNPRPLPVRSTKESHSSKNTAPQNQKPSNQRPAVAKIDGNQSRPKNVPQNGNSVNQRPTVGKIVSQNRNLINQRPTTGNVTVGNRSRINSIPQNRNPPNQRPAAANINRNVPGIKNVSQILPDIRNNLNRQPAAGNINRNTSRTNTVPNQHTDVTIMLLRVEGKLDLVLQKVDLGNEFSQRCSKKATAVKLAVDGNAEILKNLEVQMANMAIAKVCAQTDEIKQRFPLKSVEDLELLEDDLSDPNFRKNLVSYFSRKNVKTVGDSVRKMVKEMITDRLASQFSMTGQKGGKLPLNKYGMFITAFQDAVRVTHDLPDEAIMTPLKVWLVKAKHRLSEESDDEIEDQDGSQGEFDGHENEDQDGSQGEFDGHENEDQDGSQGEFDRHENEDQDGSHGEFDRHANENQVGNQANFDRHENQEEFDRHNESTGNQNERDYAERENEVLDDLWKNFCDKYDNEGQRIGSDDETCDDETYFSE